MNKFWIDLKGKSMSPLLLENDRILIESIAVEAVSVGDILLFIDQQSKEITLHRLIELPNKTKGDLSLLVEVFDPSTFLGKAVGFMRRDIYQSLPIDGSYFNLIFLKMSKLRMKGFFIRKMAYVMLLIFARFFLFYNGKTKLNHNEEQTLENP